MIKKPVRNIILDLGGVLLNIDYEAPVISFEKMGIPGFHEVYSKRAQSPLFDAFEKGLVTPEEFRDELRTIGKFDASDESIDQAWNSMLKDLPPQRMQLLEDLKKRGPLFLLSNTNEIHIDYFEKDLDREYGRSAFQEQFDKYYYSCRMKMRKPDPEIFLFVLQENDLDPSETLFIDDSPQHVEGAGKAGIRAAHLANGMELKDLLLELGVI
jgi:glucose-1-phosphatase